MAEKKKTDRKQKREQRRAKNRQQRVNIKILLSQLPGGSKRVYMAVGLVFFVMLLIFVSANIITPDRKFSDNENRMLATKPKFSLESLVSGRFMKQYEEYSADQFAGRNFWVQLKILADSVTGKKEEKGVFNGRNSYLLEEIKEPDEEDLKKNLSAMKSFRQTYPDVSMHMMLVPNAANVLKKYLPAFAVTADQNALMNQVRAELGADFNWIDVEKTMKKHADEDIYYRTDHHWTTLGAYYAFQDAAATLGISEEEQIPMKACGVSNNFNGTLSALSGYQAGYKEAMYIYLPEGENVPQTVVNYVEEQKKTASLYDSSKLEEKDKYAVFLGGNHSLIDIKTTAAKKDRLLIVKDSYANCFIPFLVPYYREIVVVDPRYYTGDMQKLMDENKITSVLFLYNANTFFEDRMLAGVLPAGQKDGEESRGE